MKNFLKHSILYSLILGGAALFAGCAEEEKLDLPGLPNSDLVLAIADIAEGQNPQNIALNAVYNNKGKLEISGETTRTYTIRLSTPQSKDVLLYFQPLVDNLTEDLVDMSVKQVVIPAGYVSTSVTVGLTKAFFEMANNELEPKIYEVGLRITGAVGLDNVTFPTEAKVVIDKEAYVVNCSISGEGGNAVTFQRSYWDGAILNPELMSHKFKAYLDKPAKSDVKVSLKAAGLAAQFMKDMSFTPAELLIPAGATESSEEATWTVTNDFLLTTAGVEKHNIIISQSLTSDDKTVAVSEKTGEINITVLKGLEAVVVTDKLGEGWKAFSRAGWIGVDGGDYKYGKPSNLLKNTEIDGFHYWLDIDMLSVKALAGFSLRAYNSGSYSAKKVAFHISDDNVNWTSIGTLNPAAALTQYYKMQAPLQTRYLRLEVIEGYLVGNTYGSSWLMDFNVYGL